MKYKQTGCDRSLCAFWVGHMWIEDWGLEAFEIGGHFVEYFWGPTSVVVRCYCCFWSSDVGRWTLDVGHWTLDVGRRSSVQIEQRQRRDNFAMLMAANLRKIAVQGAQSIPNANASVCVDWFIRKGAGAGHTKNLQKSFKKQANGDRA